MNAAHFRSRPRQPEARVGVPTARGAAAAFLATGLAPALLLAIGLGLGVGAGVALAAAALGFAAAASAASLHLRVVRTHRRVKGEGAALGAQSRVDTLTGLLNRGAFLERLRSAPSADGRYACLFFFDLDRFKDVNDTMGHRAGDAVLAEVARRCLAVLGPDVPFARLGGDEFAALIRGGPEGAPEDVGRAIVEAVGAPMTVDGKVVSVGASVGVAVGSLDEDGADELLRRADVAMYEAKGSERGACRVYDAVLSDRHRVESTIRIELGRSAILEELRLLYQPLVDARTGAMSSVEGLLRWRSAELGDISPSMLVPIAEACGHIATITDWTLDQALAAIPRLGGAGAAVNVSPLYFKHPDFVHRIFDRLIAARVRPELLTLEITEGVLISNMERSQAAIGRLRDIGVRVVLDDFGTGYSSLSYLQNFALDAIKLDRSFLRNVGTRPQATQIVRTMVDFGHSLDMKVAIEGVESEWQIRLLQLLGCDLLQGYALSPPVELEDLLAGTQQWHLSNVDERAAEVARRDGPRLSVVA